MKIKTKTEINIASSYLYMDHFAGCNNIGPKPIFNTTEMLNIQPPEHLKQSKFS